VLIKPIEFGSLNMFHEQDCQYTVSLRGIADGEAKVQNRVVTAVADAVDTYKEYEKYMDLAKIDTLRFVVSNTTEAGIVFDDTDKMELEPPKTFPGKLTKFLYERYQFFNGAEDKGLVMLPVELIDDNGIMLKKCVLQLIALWGLEDGFKAWVENACIFTSTLVDRIITGYPRDEVESIWQDLGYEDRILVTGEPFALWVIESDKDISKEFPLPDAGLPVIFTDNQKPYKQRKVRILNGAHTSFVLASYLAGNDIVLESMQDDDVKNFMMKTIFDEVIPTLTLPKEELEEFANAVITRFNNPYVKHALLSISLNSVSKWRARCLPSFLGYVEKYGKLPVHLTFSIAALMAFYTGSEIRDKALIGHRDGQEYNIMDDAAVLEFFRDYSGKDTKAFVDAYLSNENFHGQDLTKVEGLSDAVASYLDDIKENGMRAALCKTL
ncbi:MAG: tagaturonate reductase, partial [Lachnospiraceae bacterium]|nr:tagaturonate reductase [Lachnospiraceae bacterium]